VNFTDTIDRGPKRSGHDARMPRASSETNHTPSAAVLASPFTALGLSPAIVRAIVDEGYETPTPVQTEVVPRALLGRDVLAGAQTGTGKTAAFVLPILQHIAESKRTGEIRALILTPTRELAAQIAERISAYGRFLDVRHAVIYGGVSQRPQEEAMRRKPDILVATPGRLLDLMQQGFVRLDGVTHFVLDEADRMLDMGFIHDVRRVVVKLPKERQTLFFSATIAPAIESLAQSMLELPIRVAITPKVTTAEGVDQLILFVEQADKRATLERLLSRPEFTRTIVFTRTKHGANRLCQQLERAGIRALALHGNKSQGARERALGGFRDGSLPVLVATDVAARGIDVDGVSHVVNYEIPNIPESYVHRIGRTGRAGAVGLAVSLVGSDERAYLSDIERLIKKEIPLVDDALQPIARPAAPARMAARPAGPESRSGGGGGARRRFRGSRR
jgi:ATP-dependent RNA helicase RhlE